MNALGTNFGRSSQRLALHALILTAAISGAAAADTISGAGGTIIGLGGQSWTTGAGATALPNIPATNTSSVVISLGVASINSITIHGLTHTWLGDTHAVLEDPSGNEHNIYVRPGLFTTSPFGNQGDFAGGDYTFIESGAPNNLPTTSSPVVNPPPESTTRPSRDRLMRRRCG
jgi:hypothetical protein